MKRGESGLSGIVCIDKPLGVTSHDVVNRCRRIFGERRVGHAGTLDPAASGLLVVCIGPATRLSPYLTSDDKRYEGRVVFGTRTDTDDADGRVIETATVPDEVADPFFAAAFISSLVGTHDQVPPAYSAIKREGRIAYEAAREGKSLELEAREIEVLDACLLGLGVEDEAYWDIRLSVSKGTYIRALARDIGSALGTAAHLGALRRISCGRLDLSLAVTLDELASRNDPTECFINPVSALGFPTVEVSEAESIALYQGKRLAAPAAVKEGHIALIRGGDLLSVHMKTGDELIPLTVIPGGVRGVCEQHG